MLIPQYPSEMCKIMAGREEGLVSQGRDGEAKRQLRRGGRQRSNVRNNATLSADGKQQEGGSGKDVVLVAQRFIPTGYIRFFK